MPRLYKQVALRGHHMRRLSRRKITKSLNRWHRCLIALTPWIKETCLTWLPTSKRKKTKWSCTTRRKQLQKTKVAHKAYKMRSSKTLICQLNSYQMPKKRQTRKTCSRCFKTTKALWSSYLRHQMCPWINQITLQRQGWRWILEQLSKLQVHFAKWLKIIITPWQRHRGAPTRVNKSWDHSKGRVNLHQEVQLKGSQPKTIHIVSSFTQVCRSTRIRQCWDTQEQVSSNRSCKQCLTQWWALLTNKRMSRLIQVWQAIVSQLINFLLRSLINAT